METRRPVAVLLAFVAITACGSIVPELPEKPAVDVAFGHLLLYPTGAGAELIGRAVQRTPDGAWSIADGRAPGCRVDVRREAARYRTRRRVRLEALAALSAEYHSLVRLTARYGSIRSAELDVANTEVLRGRFSGDCGEAIIGAVFVGRGSRRLLASAEQSLGVAAGSSAAASGRHVDLEQTEWQEPQAYAFEVRRGAATRLGLQVDFPSRLRAGTRAELKIKSDRPAWLVVIYLEDADGRGEVLWPSVEEPAPMAAPGRPAVLPSAAERRAGLSLRASLRRPGVVARETLIVYAFADRADFDRLRPLAGGGAADGAAYAAALTRALSGRSASAWSRSVVPYVVEPAEPPADP